MIPTLVLYHSPGACSQVCVFALEQAGLAHEVRLVDLKNNEQASPEYAKVSKLAKVPAIAIDGQVLTENSAIQTYIAELCPDAGLFPVDRSPWAMAQRVSGLSFCAGTLHPIVRGLSNPSRITEGETGGVRQKSISLAEKNFGYADQRIGQSGWWLGEFSVIDVYLNWAVSVAMLGGFEFSSYPALHGLKRRLMERPAFARMMAREADFREVLETKRGAR